MSTRTEIYYNELEKFIEKKPKKNKPGMSWVYEMLGWKKDDFYNPRGNTQQPL